MSCSRTCLFDWNSLARVVNNWFVLNNGVTFVNYTCLWMSEIVLPQSNEAVKTLWLGTFCMYLGINNDAGRKSSWIVCEHLVSFVNIPI